LLIVSVHKDFLQVGIIEAIASGNRKVIKRQAMRLDPKPSVSGSSTFQRALEEAPLGRLLHGGHVQPHPHRPQLVR
jgi:hypothetical protein